MNRERIASLLQEPARVAREDLAGLRELKERYPWFSGAHLLLALGEHASGEVLFDETLVTTAAHVPSREVLWESLHMPATAPGPEAVVIPLAPAQEAPITPAMPHVPPAAVDTADSRLNEAKAARAEAPPEAIIPGGDPQEQADRLLQRQIIEAAAASAFSLQDLDDLPSVEDRAVPAPAAPVTPTVEDTLGPRSFLSWLDAAPAGATPTVAFSSGPRAEPQDWLRRPMKSGVPGMEDPAPGPSHTRDLIDRFLEKSTPEPKRTEFFSPQQAGRRSIEEKMDIATETLARIHEKQGHWARAARIYRHLALKHPEKSGYFAALAKKAEDNLNP